MNAPFTVALSKLIKELKLERIYLPRDASEILVTSSDVNRPGLYLAGFYDFFDNVRIQLMGKAECGYLETLCEGSRAQILDDFFAQKPPALIITRGLDVTDEMLKFAKKYEVPILRTEESTSNFMSGLIAILSVDLAPRITRHGVLVEVYGEGILLLGESGVGKSETAIELVNRGHRLIADDAVEIRRVSNRTLVGSAPENIRHFVELRGIGIINARRIFGMGAIKVTEKIDMVIQLEHWNSEKVYDRMGMEYPVADHSGAAGPQPCNYHRGCRDEQPSKKDGLQRGAEAFAKARHGGRRAARNGCGLGFLLIPGKIVCSVDGAAGG